MFTAIASIFASSFVKKSVSWVKENWKVTAAIIAGLVICLMIGLGSIAYRNAISDARKAGAKAESEACAARSSDAAAKVEKKRSETSAVLQEASTKARKDQDPSRAAQSAREAADAAQAKRDAEAIAGAKTDPMVAEGGALDRMFGDSK